MTEMLYHLPLMFYSENHIVAFLFFTINIYWPVNTLPVSSRRLPVVEIQFVLYGGLSLFNHIMRQW